MEALSKRDYENGFKRLVIISRGCGHSDVREPDAAAKDYIVKNVCAVCGYTWKGKSADKVPANCPKCRSSLWNVKGLYHHSCAVCGHTWVSRKESPTRCPGCKSKVWREWSNHYVCDDCGYTMDVPQKSKVLDRCPKCSSRNWGCDYVRCVCRRCGYSGFYKSDRPGRCPVCKTTVYNGKAGSVDAGDGPDTSDQDIDGRAVSVLNGYDPDMEMDTLNSLLNLGINYEEAGIMMAHIKGRSDIQIARDMDLAYGTVRTIANALDSRGVRRYTDEVH